MKTTLFILLFGFCTGADAQSRGSFIPAGNLTTPRQGHRATLLLDGRVLITGGSTTPGRPTSAELFDPATNTFTATGDMTTGRANHSSTLLPDGRVLIAGGDAWPNQGTAELYDPSTGTFRPTGNMIAGQFRHRATLLNNGKVLIAGGGKECPNMNDGCANADRPELYDPAIGSFTAVGDYADRTGDPWFETQGLIAAPATLLSNGKVLIAAEPSAELYDPPTGTFELAGPMTRKAAYDPRTPGWQVGGTATLLMDGRVLLAGGEEFETSYLAEAELYDPSTGTFAAIGRMIKAREGHTATLLPDGTILIAGGWGWDAVDGRCCSSTGPRTDTELYDPATGIFTTAANLTSRRFWHTATLLMDGRVLIVGGCCDRSSGGTAELYVPSVLTPAPVVKSVRIDRAIVIAGSSYSVDISGPNLNSQMFFDVRFTSPGTDDSAVVLNWQRGLTAIHDVPAGIALGSWTINGMRAHEVETDHTGAFFPVTATITVVGTN